jgi:hypothetical protein
MSKRKQTPDVLAEILGGEQQENGEIVRAARAKKAQASQPAGWEYALVTFQDYKGWRPRFVNGREVRDWMSGPLIHDYLESMAEEGWELAAASAGERLYGSADSHQLYFKRSK